MPRRLIHRVTNVISMSAPFLHQAFARATANYSLDAAAWLAYLATSPLFPAQSGRLPMNKAWNPTNSMPLNATPYQGIHRHVGQVRS